MMTIILISIAGGFGALVRFIVDGLVRTKLGREFPWGTMVVNISGSLLLGFTTGFILHNHPYNALIVTLAIGFCGGYTTFSTMSFETVRLMQERKVVRALSYAGGTLVLTLLGAWVGVLITA